MRARAVQMRGLRLALASIAGDHTPVDWGEAEDEYAVCLRNFLASIYAPTAGPSSARGEAMTSSTLVRKSAMVAAATVSAVAFVAPARADLTKVPGLNEVQAPVAATIQYICPRLNNRDILPDPTPQQRQLALECSKMVQTSNAQQGSGNMTLNLGLSEEQLRFGLQGIAPDEMGAQSQQSTVASGKAPIAGRLLALRGGARGFSVAGLTGDVDGVGVAAERVNARGGGAAADGPSRWGGFVNVNYNKGDRSTTERQFGFDFDSW